MKNIWKLLISFGATFAAAAVGSLVTFQSIPTWYATLNKTIISPPNWVFGPAWTLLYILMATAMFMVWKQGLEKQKIQEALQLFLAQLILNALWSVVFFGFHLIFTAFLVIILLLIFIVLTTLGFYRVKKLAAYLMIPYIAWVSFAAVLNYMTYIANR